MKENNAAKDGVKQIRKVGYEKIMRLGFNVGGDIGYDVLRGFWPEIAWKFRLPFRGQSEPGSPGTGSETK